MAQNGSLETTPQGPSLKTIRVHEATYQSLIGLLLVRETMDQLLQRLIREVLTARATSRRRRRTPAPVKATE